MGSLQTFIGRTCSVLGLDGAWCQEKKAFSLQWHRRKNHGGVFWVPEQLREKDRFLVTIILNDEMLPEGAVEAGTVAEVHLRVLSSRFACTCGPINHGENASSVRHVPWIASSPQAESFQSFPALPVPASIAERAGQAYQKFEQSKNFVSKKETQQRHVNYWNSTNNCIFTSLVGCTSFVVPNFFKKVQKGRGSWNGCVATNSMEHGIFCNASIS